MKNKKSFATRYCLLNAGMHLQQRISSNSGSEMIISAGGVRRRPRRGSTSSATAGSGRRSSRHCGRQSGEQPGRCWRVQISELFSLEKCDQAVILPRDHGGGEVPMPPSKVFLAFFFLYFFLLCEVIHFAFICYRGRRVEEWYLSPSSRGRGSGLCHALDRVNAV
jgi:hypothetical protein